MASSNDRFLKEYVKRQKHKSKQTNGPQFKESSESLTRKDNIDVRRNKTQVNQLNSHPRNDTRGGYLHKKLTDRTGFSGIQNINSFPNEVLYQIFKHFSPNELLSCARVCKRWKQLAMDNVLWRKIYSIYGIKHRGTGDESQITDPSHWKKLCITRCREMRDKRILPMLKKVSKFTGLCANTEKALRTAGVRWILCFEDHDGVEHVMSHSDVFYFSMSVCVRWYALTTPPLHNIRRLKIYAANPIFFSDNGEPAVNSPCQRSLLFEMEFRWSEWIRSREPQGGDDVIDVHIVPGGLLVATFKDKSSIAFVTANFHSRSLVKRCLMGTSKMAFIPPRHRPVLDDIDPKYGLHSYTCTTELRNQRTSFWSEQFRNLYCDSDFVDGFARFVLLNPDNEYERSVVGKKISFLWKTDVFKGCVQNLCFLDVSLLDERQEPLWCGSSAVSLTEPVNNDVTYAFSGNHFTITHEDDLAKIKMKLIWEAENKEYQMVGFELFLSLQYINRWFGTQY